MSAGQLRKSHCIQQASPFRRRRTCGGRCAALHSASPAGTGSRCHAGGCPRWTGSCACWRPRASRGILSSCASCRSSCAQQPRVTIRSLLRSGETVAEAWQGTRVSPLNRCELLACLCCIVKPHSTHGQKLCKILCSPMRLLVLNTKNIPNILQQSMLRSSAWWTRQCRLFKVEPEALLYPAWSHRQLP